MKYLDYPELESLSRALTFESAECKVFTRIEAYSCKAVKKDKKLFKTLESNILKDISSSPPEQTDSKIFSPFGRLDHPSPRKTLFLLIATLNGAFPDHDFSDVNTADFKRETNSDSVLSSLGTTLLSLRSHSNAPRSFSSFPSSYDEVDAKRDANRTGPASMAFSPSSNSNNPSINHPQLAAVLDDIMCIPDCEVYSFHPDAESDPHACAEPDEEGEEFNDDRYADGDEDEEAWSEGEGYEDESNTAISTPKHFHDEELDAPMFDEDLIGTGFTPSSSQFNNSQPPTPRTPSSTRARAGDFFSLRRKVVASKATPALAHSSSLSSADSFTEDDDGDGLHGLLWATYAFFYNRKLKRILFVSVWSRRNAVNSTYSFSPPSYPSMTYSQPVLSTFSLDEDGFEEVKSAVPSPAKRAIAKSTTKSRRRSMSSSPAPSALSPFPHASPLGASKLSSGGGSITSPLVQPIRSMTIADALKQGVTSSSAPSSTRIASTPSNAKRSVDGNPDSSSKEQARKQRKVGDSKGPGKPLAA